MCMDISKTDILTKQPVHPIQYLDKVPEDLFFLTKKFGAQDIDSYDEDLNAEAELQLETHKKSIKDYSLIGDLIPQVVQLVTLPALQTSLKVLGLTTDEDTILYLGRSPSILHTISRYLAPKICRSSDQHIQLNYSGSANIPNSRNMGVNELRNVITKNRLLHFFQYLDEKGLGKLTSDKNLYITDQVGKGGGMNAFLRILRYYYVNYKNLETTPNVTILLMNFNDKDLHVEKGYYMYNPKSATFMFCGMNDQNKGFRSLSVKAMSLSMSEEEGGVLDAMDDELVQQYLLPARSYPAYCWTEKYDAYRDSTPELATVFTKALLEACDIMLNQKN